MERDTDRMPEGDRPYSSALCRLRAAGLRPTQQRLGLAKILFEAGDRHVTAEALHTEAQAARLRVSLATVYNTLHQFTEAGLLRQVVVDSGRAYFDTNTGDHHHFYFEEDGTLADICGDGIEVLGLPAVPGGNMVSRVDVIVRIRADVPES
jgi:Fur family iron response transcriptional regulator